jgi:23S rRNA (cytosine1962-C5)-methyltransferase
MLHNRLQKVWRHLSRQAKRMGISCYRVYDHDLPEFPFCLEIYDDKLYLAEYKRHHSLTEHEHESWLQESIRTISEVLEIAEENIFFRRRQKKEGRSGQYKKVDQSHHEFEVEENGLKFIVNLSDYLDTGLFLDHRITRQMVRERSKDKIVLNLFAYTGSFSVYAAAGGADKIVTADLSKTYLDWAKRNMQLNGYGDEDKYQFVQADVKQYLQELTPSSFDLIILDPPTFSNSQRMKDFLDIQRDHVMLINKCLELLKPRGSIYFSTNFRKFSLDKEAIDSKSIKDITKATTPFDFEGKLFRHCFVILKT